MHARGDSMKYTDPSGHVPYPITIRSFAPSAYFGGGFHRDNRGYSASDNVTARVHQQLNVDTDHTVINATAWSSPSFHWLLPSFQATAIPASNISELWKTENGSSRFFSFNSHYAGSNPLTPGAPSIDVFSQFFVTEDRDNSIT